MPCRLFYFHNETVKGNIQGSQYSFTSPLLSPFPLTIFMILRFIHILLFPPRYMCRTWEWSNRNCPENCCVLLRGKNQRNLPDASMDGESSRQHASKQFDSKREKEAHLFKFRWSLLCGSECLPKLLSLHVLEVLLVFLFFNTYLILFDRMFEPHFFLFHCTSSDNFSRALVKKEIGLKQGILNYRWKICVQ